jgi:hypothetical protein
MSNQPNEFFTVSLDQAANRELAYAISAQVVAELRPAEAIFTEHAFDPLMDMAARGEVARVGSGAEFGLGAAELLLLVVVPAVTSALTTYFIHERVAGIGGAEGPPPDGELVSSAQIRALVSRSGVRISRRELDRLCWLVNQQARASIAEWLAALARAERSPADGVYCGYDREALRDFLCAAFSLDELRSLCWELGENHEDALAEGVALSGNVRRMLEHFGRRGRHCELIAAARKRREGLDWEHLTPPTL